MYLRINYSDGCHQVMANLPSSFFQMELAKNGKIIDSPEQRANDIMHDFKASSCFLFKHDKDVKTFISKENKKESILIPFGEHQKERKNELKLIKKMKKEISSTSNEQKAKLREEVIEQIVKSNPRFNIVIKLR